MQTIEIAAIAVFVFSISCGVLWLIDTIMGARISPRVEELGQDAAKLGIELLTVFVLARPPQSQGDVAP